MTAWFPEGRLDGGRASQSLDRVGRHPNVDPLELCLQPLLEFKEELSVLELVCDIHEYPNQVIPIRLASVLPQTTYRLSLGPNSTKMLLQFEQSVGDPSSDTRLPSLNRSGSRIS